MGIERHDWFISNGGGVECQNHEPDPAGVNWRREPDAGCRGCGALIPGKETIKISEQFASEAGQGALDRLWHEEHRPMAALACLVEESQT